MLRETGANYLSQDASHHLGPANSAQLSYFQRLQLILLGPASQIPKVGKKIARAFLDIFQKAWVMEMLIE